MKVRTATLEDIEDAVRFGQLMHAESPHWSRLTFSPEKLRSTMTMLVNEPRAFLRVVCTDDGVPLGGMGALLMPHWASDDLYASDLFMFMHPEARGTLAPVRLVKAYRQWAKENGAKLVLLGITTGVHTEQTAALFERLGMKRCGVILEE